jgi:NAD(P)-dependent dehydrogenase (short-subunit alcohol dehydrogenase family)
MRDHRTSLSGRVALVTGSTSGIGHGIARELAAAGAHVVVSGRDERRGRAIVEASRVDGAETAFASADLSTDEGAIELAAQATRTWGHVDILVNNAAAFPLFPIAEDDVDRWHRMFQVNVRSPHLLTRALVPAMAARGWGRVINVTSSGTIRAFPTAGVYGATKAALSHLTLAWATEYGQRGISVNAVAPGPVPPDDPSDDTRDRFAARGRELPGGRPGAPRDIAGAVLFLASDAAEWVHGTTIVVDGGQDAVTGPLAG